MIEFFWGLFHWTYRERWMFHHGTGTSICLSRWFRVWDKAEIEAFEQFEDRVFDAIGDVRRTVPCAYFGP